MIYHSDTLVLGTRKGVLLFRRGRQGWTLFRQAKLGTPIAYAAADPRTGTLWACIDHGHWGQKLERSPDLGETWEPADTPKYPDDAEYLTGYPGAEEKTPQPATLQYLWVLVPGPSDQPGRLYAGTVPGGLFRSDDNGDSFHLVQGLWNHSSRAQWFGGGKDNPGIHSLVVDPRDSNHVYIGISCAGVFETTDGGHTWEPRNRGLKATFLPNPEAEIGHDPHYLAMCAARPEVLWQQNHCGIFRTESGGREWRQVSAPDQPAHFGFPIAADVENPEVAWVVPEASDEQRVAINGALCVCRTDDSGKSWTAFRSGLPQEQCYDLVLRHALDVSGDTLAFATTTGNVYVSEDRGESWSCLGNHFPPVYSVRFVPTAA